MKPKFTPGPWKIGIHGGSVIAKTEKNISVPGAIGNEAKKYYGGFLVGESISPGNCALIQISPDMYTLLQTISEKDNVWKALIDPILDRAKI